MSRDELIAAIERELPWANVTCVVNYGCHDIEITLPWWLSLTVGQRIARIAEVAPIVSEQPGDFRIYVVPGSYASMVGDILIVVAILVFSVLAAVLR